MNPQKFAACLADLHEWAGRLRRTERLIVYGSVARDTAAEESDLDVLIVCRRDRHEALAHELFLLGARYDVTVSPFLVEPAELAGLDRQLLESVARDGRPLKGPPLDPTVRTLDLRPHYLVTLYLDHLSQKTKVKLSRELYGYRTVRRYKRAKYASARKGLLDRVGGWKLGRGTVLVPAKVWPDLEAVLRKYRAKRWAFAVWVQAP